MERNQEKIWFVVDANIIFSALIKDESIIEKIIFSNKFKLLFPNDGLLELDKY